MKLENIIISLNTSAIIKHKETGIMNIRIVFIKFTFIK